MSVCIPGKNSVGSGNPHGPMDDVTRLLSPPPAHMKLLNLETTDLRCNEGLLEDVEIVCRIHEAV